MSPICQFGIKYTIFNKADYFSHLQSLYNLKIKIRPRYFGNENISTLEKLMYSNLWKAFEYLGIFTTDK